MATLKEIVLLDTGVVTSTQTGATLDMGNLNRTVPDRALMASVVSSWTDGNFASKVETSPDGSNWVTLMEDTTGQSAAGIVTRVVPISGLNSGVGVLRYVRGICTVTGASTGAAVKITLHPGTY